MKATDAAEWAEEILSEARKARVRSFRLRMRRASWRWRQACYFKQWETALLALQSAIHYREMAKITGA